jgi:hypothetical protein
MSSSSPFQCLTLILLLLPVVILAIYITTSFPSAPDSLLIHPGLASLAKDSRSWTIYPEDVFDGGDYAAFPYGRTRYWLFGPEDGIKVRYMATLGDVADHSYRCICR